MSSQLSMVCSQALLVLLLTSSLSLALSLQSRNNESMSQDNVSTQEQMNTKLQDWGNDLKKLKAKFDKIICRLKNTEENTSNSCQEERPKVKVFTLHTSVKRSWDDASNDCLKNDTKLASIENEDEYNKVMELIIKFGKRNNGDDFWLSGTDVGHEGRFVWASTGRDVTFNKWYPSYPRNETLSNGESESKDCLEINQRLHNAWQDYYCSHRQYYICHHWE